MKIFKKIFIIFILLNNYIYSDDNTLFNQANQMYSKCCYDKAIDLYNSINNKNYSCWFNIGNCYFKLKKYNLAMAYWKKALNNSPYKNNEDIEFNLSKVGEILSIQKNKNNFIKKYLDSIPTFYLEILFLIFWYLFFLFVVRIIKKKFYLVLSSFFLCNIFLFCCLSFKYNEKNDKAIVLQKDTPVFAGPGKDYHIIGLLNMAQELKINYKNGEWVKISSNELTGWTLASSIFNL